jgi:outer membrane protein assembly factor BamB
MKSFLFLFYFLLCFSEFIFPQKTLTAIITDPQIGSDNGETFLNSVSKDISQRKEIERVIIFGNLTANGNYDEFDQLKAILDGMDKEYSLAGGPNDYLLSESNGLEIVQLWDYDKYHISSDGYDLYIIDTIIKYTTNGHLLIETLDWINNNSENTNNVNFIFSFYPINKVYNGYKLSNNFAGEKIISFSPDLYKNQKKKPGTDEIKTKKLSESKKWNYQLLSVVNDSLIYYNVSEKDIAPKLISILPFADMESVSKVDSTEIVLYNKNLTIEWQIEFGVTNEVGILLSGDKVFTADNNGIITCLNNDGKEKWHYETNSAIKTNLLLYKDLIIAATIEGDLFTINSNNGDLVQVIGTGETILNNIAMINTIYNDMKTKGIIFGTTAGNIYCYELYSLEMIWDGYLTDYKISSLIKANNDKIIILDSKNKIYCINSSNGLLIWEWQAKVKKINPFFVSDIICDGKSVYLADSDGIIHCVDLLLGTESWKKKFSSTGNLSLSSDKKYLIIKNTKNEITFISRMNGKVQRKIKLADEIKEKKINFINVDKDSIYLGYENGILYRINNNNRVEKILYMGNSPLISFNKINDNKFIVSNLDGRLIQFSFR